MSTPNSQNPNSSNPSNDRGARLGKKPITMVINAEPSFDEFGANGVWRIMEGRKEVSMLSPPNLSPSFPDRLLMAPREESGVMREIPNPLILLASVAEWEGKEEGKDRAGKEKVIKKKNSYTCAFCKEIFRSRQALGGHRATHKGVKGCFAFEKEKEGECSATKKKVEVEREYKCDCGRSFVNAQGLGAHKRIHFIDQGDREQAVVPLPPPPPSPPIGDYRLDLNMPAPEGFEQNGNIL